MCELWAGEAWPVEDVGRTPLEEGIVEGENPVCDSEIIYERSAFDESSCLGLQL